MNGARLDHDRAGRGHRLAQMTPDEALDFLAHTAAQHGLPWQTSWQQPLTALLSWLARFSVRTNLVGDHRPGWVVAEHLIETLTVAASAEHAGCVPRRIVDVGAGAGLEVLLLALWAPQAQLVAVEPRRKRADFIELVADAMGVGGRLRVERSQVPAWQPAEGFDLATSRATFAPAQWLLHGQRLTRQNGVIVVHDAVGPANADAGNVAGSSPHVVEWQVPNRPAHCIRAYRHLSPVNPQS